MAVESDIRSKARKFKSETVQDLHSIVGNKAVSRKLLVCWLWTLWLAALALWHPSLGAAQSADTIEFFEMRVRPLLAKNCFACHTASRMGGLEMKDQESFLKGGDSGPAVVPGRPDESLLIQAVRRTHERLKMPPSGKLAGNEIHDLETWVEKGAVWPELRPSAEPSIPSIPGREKGRYVITPEQRNFWSFRAVRKPDLPAVKNESWVSSPIDAFVLAKLEARGLKPVQAAQKRVLLRRAYMDLIGLPPTPEEADAFFEDTSSRAFARVVDRLLSSPLYGERWGRHWLDIARYSDEKWFAVGGEPSIPNAFYYRDWVIEAFNSDMPYDLFVKAQIADDGLEGFDNQKLVGGLGFFVLVPRQADDRVDVTTRAFLGLTVACAQCHDHKLDPIPTEDYYALQGVFNSTKVDEYPLVSAEVVERYQRLDKEVKAEQTVLREFLDSQRVQLREALAAQTSSFLVAAWKVLGPEQCELKTVAREESLDPETLERWVKYLRRSPRKHSLLDRWDDLLRRRATEAEVRLLADRMQRLVISIIREKKKIAQENKIRMAVQRAMGQATVLKEGLALEKERYYLWQDLADNDGILSYSEEKVERFLAAWAKEYVAGLRAQLDALKKKMPQKYPFLPVISDVAEPKNERVHIRGSEDNLGDEVPRRFLSILSGAEPKPFSRGSGRLELAQAIADAGNPLTARVIANRIWQYHFGRGIVGTPSNFGQLGERPTHPELLDYLATRLIENNWSIKAVHREIMLSTTYRLSAEFSAQNHQVDPDNHLLWRANRRRLDVEALRDSLLYVTGSLDLTRGGPSVPLTEEDNRRRTAYGRVSRAKLDVLLRLFDFPNPVSTSAQRFATNTPLQGLFFINSEFVMRQADALAARLQQEAGSDREAKILRAYRLLFNRTPTQEELRLGLEFVAGSPKAWPRYTHVLLNSSEFLYVN